MRKTAKRITAVLLAAALMIGSTVGVMAAEPVRDTFEAAGATVTWDYEGRLIVIEIAGSTIVLTPGSNTALVNSTALELVPPYRHVSNGLQQ